jgi:hypothetical protein
MEMPKIDKDYQKMITETIRKIATRRIAVNDIFNYRSLMTNVNNDSELVMPDDNLK